MKNMNEFFANKNKKMLVDGDLLVYKITSAIEEPIDWGNDFWTLHADLKLAKHDFELREKMLLRESICNYVFTGCQIINKELFDDINEEVFSILKIWNQQINKKKLYGYEYKGKFIHLTDLEIFKQLTKK